MAEEGRYVRCVTPGCSTRTPPRIAARDWEGGVCDLCSMTQEEREALALSLRRAEAAFREMDRERGGKRERK